MAESRAATLQIAGTGGKIVLGKEYAGRFVLVETLEPGVWSMKAGIFVPDNERWRLDPKAQAGLDKVVAGAVQNPPRETDLDESGKRVLGDSCPGSTGSE